MSRVLFRTEIISPPEQELLGGDYEAKAIAVYPDIPLRLDWDKDDSGIVQIHIRRGKLSVGTTSLSHIKKYTRESTPDESAKLKNMMLKDADLVKDMLESPDHWFFNDIYSFKQGKGGSIERVPPPPKKAEKEKQRRKEEGEYGMGGDWWKKGPKLEDRLDSALGINE